MGKVMLLMRLLSSARNDGVAEFVTIKQLIVVEHFVLFDCFASLAMNGLPRD
jgi:hypothetical protein